MFDQRTDRLARGYGNMRRFTFIGFNTSALPSLHRPDLFVNFWMLELSQVVRHAALISDSR